LGRASGSAFTRSNGEQLVGASSRSADKSHEGSCRISTCSCGSLRCRFLLLLLTPQLLPLLIEAALDSMENGHYRVCATVSPGKRKPYFFMMVRPSAPFTNSVNSLPASALPPFLHTTIA
jgi:hypothetical protein